jgi:hypothetical protein
MEVKHYRYVIGKNRSKKEKEIQNNKNSLKGECKQVGGKERQLLMTIVSSFENKTYHNINTTSRTI